MTMKIVAPGMLQQQMGIPKELQELLSTGKVKFPGIRGWLPESVKRDEFAEVKPLDYVEPYRGAKLGAVTVDEARNVIACDPGHDEGTVIAYAVASIFAKPRYTGNNLEVEVKIALEMETRDRERAWKKSVQDSRPIFHPTSLSAFVQDHRIMRKGPWR